MTFRLWRCFQQFLPSESSIDELKNLRENLTIDKREVEGQKVRLKKCGKNKDILHETKRLIILLKFNAGIKYLELHFDFLVRN